jgi:multicomponent Na+:H+ antiporter subunit C
VISFALFSFILILTYRAYQELGTVDVDEMNSSEPRAFSRMEESE